MQLLFFAKRKLFSRQTHEKLFFSLLFSKAKSVAITLSNFAAEGGHASDNCLQRLLANKAVQKVGSNKICHKNRKFIVIFKLSMPMRLFLREAKNFNISEFCSKNHRLSRNFE
jgi:hypothetical protein